MLKRFNKIIFESLIERDNYNFSNDEEGNIFCEFSIKSDYVVHAKFFNDVLTFNITDKDGNSKDMSEKEFSFNYADEYEEFKKKLEAYKIGELNTDEDSENQSQIEDFKDQLVDVESDDPNVRLNKDLKLDGMLFNFKILNDLMVENYAQCTFEIFDKKKNETFGIKSLLFMKLKNSIIVKIILQDTKGQNLQNMTELDFKIAYPEEYETFKQAISKFETYLNYTK